MKCTTYVTDLGIAYAKLRTYVNSMHRNSFRARTGSHGLLHMINRATSTGTYGVYSKAMAAVKKTMSTHRTCFVCHTQQLDMLGYTTDELIWCLVCRFDTSPTKDEAKPGIHLPGAVHERDKRGGKASERAHECSRGFRPRRSEIPTAKRQKRRKKKMSAPAAIAGRTACPRHPRLAALPRLPRRPPRTATSAGPPPPRQIGRASCRERVYVLV